MEKSVEGKIERTDIMLINQRLGTTILAIIFLDETNGYARYKDIYIKVFGEKSTKKSDNAKINYYLKILKKFEISYNNSKHKLENKTITDIIENDGGIYKYNKNNLIKLFIEIFKSYSLDYLSKEFEEIFDSKEFKKAVLNYLINYSKKGNGKGIRWGEDRYSLSAILTNIELHLIVNYYEKQLEQFPKLKLWAKVLIKNEGKINHFKQIGPQRQLNWF